MEEFWQNVLNYIIENWRFLVSLFIGVITLLVTIFKKKAKISFDYFTEVLMALPGLINDAENKYQVGKEKFIYVYSAAMEMLLARYSSAVIQENKFGVLVQEAIETILTTPQKKER